MASTKLAKPVKGKGRSVPVKATSPMGKGATTGAGKFPYTKKGKGC